MPSCSCVIIAIRWWVQTIADALADTVNLSLFTLVFIFCFSFHQNYTHSHYLRCFCYFPVKHVCVNCSLTCLTQQKTDFSWHCRLDSVTAVSLESSKEHSRVHLHTSGSRGLRPKIDRLLQRGEQCVTFLASALFNTLLSLQAKAARIWSKEPTYPNFPRGNVHQQHQRHAVQEGQLRSGRSDLSRCHQVSQQLHRQKSNFIYIFAILGTTLDSAMPFGTARATPWCNISS